MSTTKNPGSPCVKRQQFLARDFVMTLTGEFAASPACAGVLVGTWTESDPESERPLLKRQAERAALKRELHAARWDPEQRRTEFSRKGKKT
jgi:hypothetical protein